MNSVCSHISVAAPGSACSCLCPDGMNLSSDGVTCSNSTSGPSVVTESNRSTKPPVYKTGTPADGNDNNVDNQKDNTPVPYTPNNSSLSWIIVIAVLLVVILVIVIVAFIWR